MIDLSAYDIYNDTDVVYSGMEDTTLPPEPNEPSMLASHKSTLPQPDTMASHEPSLINSIPMKDEDYELAIFGAQRYNASKPSEQKAWMSNAMKRKPDTKEQSDNVTMLNNTIDSFSNVFNAEKKSTGLSDDDLKKFMTMAYGAETNFGTHKTMTSSTGVVGAVQVTTDTFKDLVKQGILGPKAAEYLGTTHSKLKSLNDREIRKILRTDKGSFLAGTGKYLQARMDK